MGLIVHHGVVPTGTLAASVPPKVVRDLTGEERRAISQSAANYVAYAASSITHAGNGAGA